MRMNNVQDLPISPDSMVTPDQVDDILEYNYNDVLATYEYFKKISASIDLRANICKEYNLEVMNANDVKIGVEIFTDALADSMNISKKELKSLSTERQGISLKECILPYVKFNSPNFQSILDFLLKQNIVDTKGVFKDLPVKELGSVIDYCAKSEQKYLAGKIKTHNLITNDGLLKKLNTVHKGFQYDFGTGGIHGCISPGIYKEGNGYIIVDVDVKKLRRNFVN